MARVFRTLRAGIGDADPPVCKCAACSAKQPATRRDATTYVEPPSIESFLDRVRRGTSAGTSRLREVLTQGRSDISPAPKPGLSPGAHESAPPAPCVVEAIRKSRKEK